MGYTTQFEGELKFTEELTAKQLAYLNSILGEDCRDHLEWNAPNLYYIDLELNDDFSGIEWNGAEKTYDMVDLVNVVIRLMREKYPNFGLNGKLIAQGEEVGDVWILEIENGLAVRKEYRDTLSENGMTESKAREIIGEGIGSYNTIRPFQGFEDWHPQDDTITLDGHYTAEQLEALVWWMKNKKED